MSIKSNSRISDQTYQSKGLHLFERRMLANNLPCSQAITKENQQM